MSETTTGTPTDFLLARIDALERKWQAQDAARLAQLDRLQAASDAIKAELDRLDARNRPAQP